MRNSTLDIQDTHLVLQQTPLNPQLLTAQKPQQMIENNNNQQSIIDSNQKRRSSHTKEPNGVSLENHVKSNDTHYIKNKALQSPTNRYKVNAVAKLV